MYKDSHNRKRGLERLGKRLKSGHLSRNNVNRSDQLFFYWTHSK